MLIFNHNFCAYIYAILCTISFIILLQYNYLNKKIYEINILHEQPAIKINVAAYLFLN